MFKRLILALVFLLPTPAFADDATPTPEPAATEPMPSSIYDIPVAPYTPPAEAYQGVGGWAVVHPGTGVVHGVIVATIDTFNAWGGRMPNEYMGCPAGCLLRFQTRATADGNVAGWHGPEVKFNAGDGTFDLGYTNKTDSGTTTVHQKLIPALTATDGVNLHTGIVDSRTEFISSRINDLEIKLTKIQERFDGEVASQIAIANWKTFDYTSDEQVVANLDNDIDAALVQDGYDPTDPEPTGFVATVKSLTETVKNFFSGFWLRD